MKNTMKVTPRKSRMSTVPLTFRILFYAKLRGAIGQRQLFRQVVTAPSQEIAILSLYTTHDHITVKSIR
jgi:hypothetical protein